MEQKKSNINNIQLHRAVALLDMLMQAPAALTYRQLTNGMLSVYYDVHHNDKEIANIIKTYFTEDEIIISTNSDARVLVRLSKNFKDKLYNNTYEHKPIMKMFVMRDILLELKGEKFTVEDIGNKLKEKGYPLSAKALKLLFNEVSCPFYIASADAEDKTGEYIVSSEWAKKVLKIYEKNTSTGML